MSGVAFDARVFLLNCPQKGAVSSKVVVDYS